MLRRSSNGFHTMLPCINSLQKSLILYSKSVASKDPLMVEFLVKSVGFSEKEAISIADRTQISQSLITRKNYQLVVDFLKERGFDRTQIRKVLSRFPRLLRNNVDKTLKPKFRAFEDVGFSGSNLGLILSRHSHILGWGLESGIVPVLGMLESLFGNNEHLVSCMLQIRSQCLVSSQVCKNLSANVLLLQSYGLTSERIKWLMLRSGFLSWKTQWAEKIVKRVEERLRIPRTSDMFTYGIYALTMRSEGKIESWLESFHSRGWNETEISSLFRMHPLILSLSEEHVRLKLKYFMDDLGLGSDYLAAHPVLLSLSMEKRIVPRAVIRQTLMDRNLLKHPISFHTFLKMPESEFMLRFVLPYKEKLPQIYENYTLAIDPKKVKHCESFGI